MAMAPPFTLTFDVSQPMSLFTAQACAAKASLASTRSRSLAFHPAFSSALRDAGIGLEAIDAFKRDAVADVFICVDDVVAFAALDRDGRDLVLEAAGLPRGFSF